MRNETIALPLPASGAPARHITLILTIGFAIRLIALPYAMSEEADATTRTWIAWRWIENPYLISEGIWAPLHFYIIAIPLFLFDDPLYPVIITHLSLAVIAGIFLYLFLVNEFGDRIAALCTTVLFLFYPVYFRASLMATAEVPYIFFLSLSLYLLSLARKGQGGWHCALLAGLAITLAGMLRYDAWLLMPMLAVALWRKPSSAAIFLATGAIFPMFWITGNWLAHGDPFYFVSWTAMDAEDIGETITSAERLKRLVFYPAALLFGLSPLVVALAGVGAARSLLLRQPQAIWIVPCVGLLAILSIKSAEGHLPMKARYTIAVGMLLLAYACEVFKLPLFRHLSGRWKAALVAVAVLSMVGASYLDRFVSSDAATRVFQTSFHAIPRVKNDLQIQALVNDVLQHLDAERDAFLSDFFGWSPTFYVALMTRMHPNRIFIAPGSKNQAFESDLLADLVVRYGHGLLLVSPGSDFAKRIGFDGSDTAIVGGRTLALETIAQRSVSDTLIYVKRFRVVGLARSH